MTQWASVCDCSGGSLELLEISLFLSKKSSGLLHPTPGAVSWDGGIGCLGASVLQDFLVFPRAGFALERRWPRLWEEARAPGAPAQGKQTGLVQPSQSRGWNLLFL